MPLQRWHFSFQPMDHYNRQILKFSLHFALALLTGWVLSVLIADLPVVVTFLEKSAFSHSLESSVIYFLHQLLSLMGYQHQMLPHHIVKIDGTRGVLIIYSCLALRHIAQFSGFMLVIKGPWKRKILYIFFGIIIIYFVNILRIYIATIAQYHCPRYEMEIHYYGGRILLYGTILLLWIRWINKYTFPYFGLNFVDK